MGWLLINNFMEHTTNKRNFSQLTFSGNWKLYVSKILLGSSDIHMGRIKPSIPFVPSLYPDPKGTEKLVVYHHRSGSVNNVSNTCDDHTCTWIPLTFLVWINGSFTAFWNLNEWIDSCHLCASSTMHCGYSISHMIKIYQEKSRFMLWNPLIDEVSPKVMLIEWSQACNSSCWSIGTLLTRYFMETNWMVRRKTQPTNKGHNLDGLD